MLSRDLPRHRTVREDKDCLLAVNPRVSAWGDLIYDPGSDHKRSGRELRAECVIVSSMTPPSPHLTITNRFTAENSEKMKKKAKRCDFRLTEKGWIISLGSMRICLYLLPCTGKLQLLS